MNNNNKKCAVLPQSQISHSKLLFCINKRSQREPTRSRIKMRCNVNGVASSLVCPACASVQCVCAQGFQFPIRRRRARARGEWCGDATQTVSQLDNIVHTASLPLPPLPLPTKNINSINSRRKYARWVSRRERCPICVCVFGCGRLMVSDLRVRAARGVMMMG